MRSRHLTAIAAAAALLLVGGLAVVVVRTPPPAGGTAATAAARPPAATAGSDGTSAAAPAPAPSPPPPSAPAPSAPASTSAPVTTPTPAGGGLAPPPQEPGPAGTLRLAPHPSAEALAADLAVAEARIRADDATAEELAVAGLVQQHAYRELGRVPEWIPVVRGLLPAPLHAAYDANLAAQGELVALTDPQEDLPSWQIVPPPPAEELVALYQATAAAFGMDWTYLAAIHLVETRMGRIRGTSTAGAQGPMQFIPPTWEIYGEGDINDVGDAVRAAARYLTARGAPGDMDRALYSYNNSDRYVRSIQSYAAVMRADPLAYRGYHGWQVFYRLASGTVLLPEGWSGG